MNSRTGEQEYILALEKQRDELREQLALLNRDLKAVSDERDFWERKFDAVESAYVELISIVKRYVACDEWKSESLYQDAVALLKHMENENE